MDNLHLLRKPDTDRPTGPKLVRVCVKFQIGVRIRVILGVGIGIGIVRGGIGHASTHEHAIYDDQIGVRIRVILGDASSRAAMEAQVSRPIKTDSTYHVRMAKVSYRARGRDRARAGCG